MLLHLGQARASEPCADRALDRGGALPGNARLAVTVLRPGLQSEPGEGGTVEGVSCCVFQTQGNSTL